MSTDTFREVLNCLASAHEREIADAVAQAVQKSTGVLRAENARLLATLRGIQHQWGGKPQYHPIAQQDSEIQHEAASCPSACYEPCGGNGNRKPLSILEFPAEDSPIEEPRTSGYVGFLCGRGGGHGDDSDDDDEEAAADEEDPGVAWAPPPVSLARKPMSFDSIDKNQDGVISSAEFYAAYIRQVSQASDFSGAPVGKPCNSDLPSEYSGTNASGIDRSCSGCYRSSTYDDGDDFWLESYDGLTPRTDIGKGVKRWLSCDDVCTVDSDQHPHHVYNDSRKGSKETPVPSSDPDAVGGKSCQCCSRCFHGSSSEGPRTRGILIRGHGEEDA